MFWSLLCYIVAKAYASPKNSTWFTRPFLLVRGWGLGTRLAFLPPVFDWSSKGRLLSLPPPFDWSFKGLPFSSLFLASSFWVLQQTGDKSECTAHTGPELSLPSPTVGDNALFLWGVRGLPHAGSRPQCPTRLQWRVQDICHCSSQLRTTTSKTCLVKIVSQLQ